MTYSARKTSLLRYGTIILLFCIPIGGILYLFPHYEKAQKLQTSISKLISGRESNSIIDSCIISLYGADNYCRLYTISGNKDYLKKFNDDVSKVYHSINALNLRQKNQHADNSGELRYLFNKKNEKTNGYLKLRLLTDSLIKFSASINQLTPKLELTETIRYIKEVPVIQPLPPPEIRIKQTTVSYDTIKKQDSIKPRKRLFGRLIAALSSKKEVSEPSNVIIKKDAVTTYLSDTLVSNFGNSYPLNNQAQAPKIYPSRRNYYKEIATANNKLRKNESQILLISNNLIDEIIGDLKAYKAIDQAYIDYSKDELKKSVSNFSLEYAQMVKISVFILSGIAILLIYTIWRLFRNEREIIQRSIKTEQYAKSKSRFLAGMSHEIRTPLNSIIGFSELLSKDDLKPAQKEQLNAITTSSGMLLDLVNEILDFSKYETGKMTFGNAPFMPENVFGDILKSMKIQATKKRIRLENHIDIEKDMCCEGDSVRLKQVVMNLLGNAIKFTVSGTVTLSAHIEHKPNKGLLLKVSVKDNGVGIAKEDLANIFDEFSQVAKAQKSTANKGTGLGLSICKKIIEMQGGRIYVNSEIGKGSEFSFDLPLKKSELTEVVPTRFFTDEEMAELVADKYILFVEDNNLNVLLGRTILKKWNIRFDIANNGREAYDLFKKNNYDAILTDIQMPEMDGMELIELIRKHCDSYKSNLPVVALTASVLEEDRDAYFNPVLTILYSNPSLKRI